MISERAGKISIKKMIKILNLLCLVRKKKRRKLRD
jgi:hypothetical protein